MQPPISQWIHLQSLQLHEGPQMAGQMQKMQMFQEWNRRNRESISNEFIAMTSTKSNKTV